MTTTLQAFWQGRLFLNNDLLTSFKLSTQEGEEEAKVNRLDFRTIQTLFDKCLTVEALKQLSIAYQTKNGAVSPVKISFPPIKKNHVYKLYLFNEEEEIVGVVRDHDFSPSYQIAVKISEMSDRLFKLILIFSIKDLKELEKTSASHHDNELVELFNEGIILSLIIKSINQTHYWEAVKKIETMEFHQKKRAYQILPRLISDFNKWVQLQRMTLQFQMTSRLSR